MAPRIFSHRCYKLRIFYCSFYIYTVSHRIKLKTVLRGTFIHQVCGDIVRNLHRLNQSKFANPVNTHYIIYVKLCGYITKNTILEYLLARSVYRNSIAIYCSE
ncbi:uncharacterized protein LOC143151812 [Ptiloglossa arizonensis]|uniref:uncharacterized protein LOC143151812 n=1 Tax=Ptiloglossa arizonensis TaxID=3350558 RepID=UPI003F9F6069